MPRQLLTELKVGLFVSVGLGLAMIIVFMLGSEHEFFTRQYTLYAHFETISGLRPGAPVQLAGLKVGYVDDVRFPKDPGQKEIAVSVRVKKKYQNRIREDSVATIETQGLLGDKFVYISMGSEDKPVIPDGGTLPTKDTTSIFELADKAGAIMDDIGEAAGTIKEVFKSFGGKKGEGELNAIMASIRKSIEQVEKGKGLFHALIYDPKGEEVITNLADTMKSVRDIVAGAEEESKGKMGGLIVNLQHASDDLRKILGTVRRGEGSLGKLINDPSLYDSLRVLLGRANRNVLLRAVIRSTIRESDRQVVE